MGNAQTMGDCLLAPRRRHDPQRTLSAKVIHVNGMVEEYDEPVAAGKVVAKMPGYYVCDCEAMKIGARPPVVADGERLQPGSLYFILPLSSSGWPLSLPDLCRLAAKASGSSVTR